eukprot:8840799-Lingulodinium_polyedra.AAC.1
MQTQAQTRDHRPQTSAPDCNQHQAADVTVESCRRRRRPKTTSREHLHQTALNIPSDMDLRPQTRAPDCNPHFDA